MLIFALMIGVVSESIGASVDSLKKGTAKVMYTDCVSSKSWFLRLNSSVVAR